MTALRSGFGTLPASAPLQRSVGLGGGTAECESAGPGLLGAEVVSSVPGTGSVVPGGRPCGGGPGRGSIGQLGWAGSGSAEAPDFGSLCAHCPESVRWGKSSAVLPPSLPLTAAHPAPASFAC